MSDENFDKTKDTDLVHILWYRKDFKTGTLDRVWLYEGKWGYLKNKGKKALGPATRMPPLTAPDIRCGISIHRMCALKRNFIKYYLMFNMPSEESKHYYLKQSEILAILAIGHEDYNPILRKLWKDFSFKKWIISKY